NFNSTDPTHIHYVKDLRKCEEQITKTMEEQLHVLALQAGLKHHEEGKRNSQCFF
ncbi:hypothetical protein BGZ90_008520, partial [Linnemannia elongata]